MDISISDWALICQVYGHYDPVSFNLRSNSVMAYAKALIYIMN